MSDLGNQSMPDDSGEWDEFELQLRAQPLGSSSPRRDDLLYQCGYAAGVAASRKQRHATVLRWQAFSAAAALLACAALAANFLSDDESTSNAKQAVLEKQDTREANEATGSANKQAAKPVWVALLTEDRSVDAQRRGHLRTTGMTLGDWEADEIEGFVVPMSPDGRGAILQPRDSSLFLQGGI